MPIVLDLHGNSCQLGGTPLITYVLMIFSVRRFDIFLCIHTFVPFTHASHLLVSVCGAAGAVAKAHTHTAKA